MDIYIMDAHYNCNYVTLYDSNHVNTKLDIAGMLVTIIMVTIHNLDEESDIFITFLFVNYYVL